MVTEFQAGVDGDNHQDGPRLCVLRLNSRNDIDVCRVGQLAIAIARGGGGLTNEVLRIFRSGFSVARE